MTNAENHITDSKLIAFIQGELTIDERKVIVEHVNNCDLCRTNFSEILTLKLENDDVSNDGNELDFDGEFVQRAKSMYPPKSTKPTLLRSIPAWIWSAAAVLIIATIFWFPFVQSEEVQLYRNETTIPVVNTITPEDGYVSDSHQILFTWEPFTGSNLYKLQLFSSVGLLLHESTIVVDPDEAGPPQANQYLIQITPEFHFHLGTNYLWKVTSYLEDGRTFESGLRLLQIQ